MHVNRTVTAAEGMKQIFMSFNDDRYLFIAAQKKRRKKKEVT